MPIQRAEDDQPVVEHEWRGDALLPKGVATCPCKWCRKPTTMLGTRMCDGCWELERRVSAQPELARRMLEALTPAVDDRFVEAFNAEGGKWPENLPSGVMFYKGLRITRDDFARARKA